MSEERSWAEDTVALGRDQIEGATETEPTPSRGLQGRRPGVPKAAGLLVGIGVMVLLVGLLGGGGEKESPTMERPAPDRAATGEWTGTTPMTTGGARPTPHRDGPLAIGRGRPAPEAPPKARPSPEPVPEPAEPETTPVYEPAPEPVAEPDPPPAPRPAAVPETPAAVEFGM